AGEGDECSRDEACAYGLICLASQVGAPRRCTADVTPIATPVDPNLLPTLQGGSAPASGGSTSGGGAGT
ncbi:MAG TPA: hypothetical protein VFQ61_20350, partial [Polyangiaceae bacterium]|nr:hypothetical protein [Polyangiaceae bacterium]